LKTNTNITSNLLRCDFKKNSDATNIQPKQSQETKTKTKSNTSILNYFGTPNSPLHESIKTEISPTNVSNNIIKRDIFKSSHKIESDDHQNKTNYTKSTARSLKASFIQKPTTTQTKPFKQLTNKIERNYQNFCQICDVEFVQNNNQNLHRRITESCGHTFCFKCLCNGAKCRLCEVSFSSLTTLPHLDF
jgi:hypothetical protein